MGDFAATLIRFWVEFSTVCQLWIGSTILDMTGYNSSNIMNSIAFYSLVLAVLLALRAYIRQVRHTPAHAEHGRH